MKISIYEVRSDDDVLTVFFDKEEADKFAVEARKELGHYGVYLVIEVVEAIYNSLHHMPLLHLQILQGQSSASTREVCALMAKETELRMRSTQVQDTHASAPGAGYRPT